jgi:hypothetical protein
MSVVIFGGGREECHLACKLVKGRAGVSPEKRRLWEHTSTRNSGCPTEDYYAPDLVA